MELHVSNMIGVKKGAVVSARLIKKKKKNMRLVIKATLDGGAGRKCL